VLDIGCARGFLIKDLMDALPGLEVFGVDISTYALKTCHPDVVGRIHLGSADDDLPFPDGAFAAVISLNAIHNLTRDRAVKAMAEVQRLSRGRAFVQVDSYHTAEQKEIFESWVLTAKFHDYPPGWLAVFDEAGYTGDWFWTVVTA
jgi:SAM-dependent methyltransferase